MKTKLKSMDERTRRLLDREVQLVIAHDTPEEHPQYVTNLETACCHTVAIMKGDVTTWITKCGFEFGVAPHELSKTPSQRWEYICHRCLYSLRAQLKKAAGSLSS